MNPPSLAENIVQGLTLIKGCRANSIGIMFMPIWEPHFSLFWTVQSLREIAEIGAKTRIKMVNIMTAVCQGMSPIVNSFFFCI